MYMYVHICILRFPSTCVCLRSTVSHSITFDMSRDYVVAVLVGGEGARPSCGLCWCLYLG